MRPAAEEDDIGAGDGGRVAIPGVRRRARHPEPRPDEGLGIQNPEVVEVALLQHGPLVEPRLFVRLLFEEEPALDQEVRPDLDRGMALSGRGRGPRAARLAPRHDLEIEDVEVVVEALPVPTPEDEHLGATNHVGRVREPRRRRARPLGSLEPGERQWVQRMKITEDRPLLALAAENNDSVARQDGRVVVARSRRGTGNLRLFPLVFVHVENECVVQVLIPLLFPRIVVPLTNKLQKSHSPRK